MTPTPEWVAADEDDEARARSSFDRADNTARLALEVADLKRERATLVAALDEARADKIEFARWRDKWVADMQTLETKLARSEDAAMAAEAEVRDLRAKVTKLADDWDRFTDADWFDHTPREHAGVLRDLVASVGRGVVTPAVESKALDPDDNHPRSPFMVQANETYHRAAGEWGFDHQRDAFLEGYRSGYRVRFLNDFSDISPTAPAPEAVEP